MICALLLVFGLLVTAIGVTLFVKPIPEDPGVFVGVDIGYGDEDVVYSVADAIQGSANLIILGSTKVTSNTSKLTAVCDYLYQRGFYFIVYVGIANKILPPRGPDAWFFSFANQRWGNRCLGVYLFDEVGGKQLDYEISNPDKPVARANNVSDAAIHFVFNLNTFLFLETQIFYSPPSNLKLYTSDYGLYWFDFLCGYDTVLCQFVGEPIGGQDRQITISLTRGASKSLGKSWGAIITYGHHDTALENGTQLYQDMILAWKSGAQYIVVFDGNSSISQQEGVLKQEHIDAIKQFWDQAKSNPSLDKYPADVAYVLPVDFGFGFRGPQDNIWGLWPSNETSTRIWNDASNLLTEYSGNIDIIFEEKTSAAPVEMPYHTLIFWNGTTLAR
jgi:hypothetical protein